MTIDSAALYRLLVDVAMREDVSLRAFGEGIFLMPERAFAYSVGKAIAAHASTILGSAAVRWLPEAKVGDSGPSDLVFDIEGGKGLALEFKMRGGTQTCARDLDKLAALDSSRYERFFCALVDAWPDNLNSDPRVVAIESHTPPSGSKAVRVPARFDFFSTLDRDFKNQLCCVVGLWRIEP